MKVLIAPDSYKESMSALNAAKAIEKGIKKVMPAAVCVIMPMADGGEGTAECLMYQQSGERIVCQVTNPLGEKIDADFIWLEQKKTAVIEVAKACGIMLIPSTLRNPDTATSYGVGELIKRALEKNCKELILTLGGTVSNDGGTGMLQALGAKLLDSAGKPIAFGAKDLDQIASVDLREPIELLRDIKVTVLCDVKNPLLGEQGATYVFGPQKGVTKEKLAVVEAAMEHYARKVTETTGTDVTGMEGAGTAGGIGFALLAISKAEFVSGSGYVMKALDLEKKIQECDFVITGEGAMDNQSLQGKVPIGVANVARKYQKPVYVFVGRQSGSLEGFYENGITAVFCILRGIKPIDKVLEEAEKNLELTVENFTRVLAEVMKEEN